MIRKLVIVLTVAAVLGVGLPATASAAPARQDTACAQATLKVLKSQGRLTKAVKYQTLLRTIREHRISGGELVLPGGVVLPPNWCDLVPSRRRLGAPAPGINLTIAASGGATFKVSVNGGMSSSLTSYWTGSVPSLSFVSITGTFGQYSPGGVIGAYCPSIVNLGALNNTGCTISGELGRASISLAP